jgi:hypothetical protein
VTDRLPPPDTSRFPPLNGEYLRVLPPDTLVGRIHFTNGPFPSAWNTFRAFGPTTNRFDHHPPPQRVHPVRAILYAAPIVPGPQGKPLVPLDTCLVEVFRDTGVVDVNLDSPYFALFRLTRQLRLLDLVDSRWITVAGGNGAISSGRRSQAREWARAIYRHYGEKAPDGLYYGCSNMPTGRSIALFEHSRDALPAHPELDLPLAHPGLWADVEYACTQLRLDLVS